MIFNKIELIKLLERLSNSIFKELDSIDLKYKNYYIPNLSTLDFKNREIKYDFEESDIEEKKKIIIDKPLLDKLILLSEYKDILELFEKNQNFDIEKSNLLLKGFLIEIIRKYNKKSNKEKLQKYIDNWTIWTNDPKFYYIKIKMFLEGVWINNLKLKLSKDLKIRRVKPSDFENTISTDIKFNFRGLPCKNFPYSVLIWNYPIEINSLNSKKVQEEILQYLRIIYLSLIFFRFGSVFTRRTIIPTNVLAGGLTFIGGYGYSNSHFEFDVGLITHENPLLNIRRNYVYTLYNEDIPKLNQIISIFNKTETRETIFTKEKTFIKIAFSRYLNSFISIESFESQITYAISCLEALFSEDVGELNRKLSQRISKIFQILGFKSLSIYNIVNKAYKIRNAYSHGSIINTNGEELKLITKQILQCARISLLFYYQFDSFLKKKEFLRSLDRKKFDNKFKNTKKNEKILKQRKRFFLGYIDKTINNERVSKKLKRIIQDKITIFL
ncbi:MAG: hypothetical protein JXA99_04460 [Candidatus Lokiarchaeota archaeon]|nr:hypothetical protein [Candidatus Lokiarchaeota archaeon]